MGRDVIMKIKKYIAGFILVLAILACAGQPPTAIDPSTIPTIVVLTANAAITQTAAAAPTSVVTQTTTPDPSAVNGTIELLSNGSTKYTDNQAGFEVTFPAGWLTLRPNSDEFNFALANDAVKNDMLRDQMEADLAEYEAGIDRLFSYPLLPDIEKNYAFGFSNTEWLVNDSTPIDENSMGQLIRSLESSGAIPGFRADTAQVYENVGNIKMIEVGGQFSMSDGQGGIIPFYLTAVFFKPTDDSTIRVSFSYLKDYKVQINSDVISVITSIKLLGQ
jgi:hypothetical protein